MESLPVDKVNTIISKTLVSFLRLRPRVLLFHILQVPFSNFHIVSFSVSLLILFSFSFLSRERKVQEFRSCFKINRIVKNCLIKYMKKRSKQTWETSTFSWELWINAHSTWLQEKWNYFIIQCSRVSKSLRTKNFSKRLLSTSHII